MCSHTKYALIYACWIWMHTLGNNMCSHRAEGRSLAKKLLKRFWSLYEEISFQTLLKPIDEIWKELVFFAFYGFEIYSVRILRFGNNILEFYCVDFF